MTRMVLPAATPGDWLAAHLATRAVEHPAPHLARWSTLDELLAADASHLRADRDHLQADGLTAGAAVTHLAAWYPAVLADAMGFAYVGSGAAFLPDPGSVAWRHHPDGWPDLVRLDDARVVVTPDHLWTGLAGVEVVPDDDALRRALVAALVATTAPLVDACHRLGRVGRVGLWNEVADGLGMSVLFQTAVPGDDRGLSVVRALLDVPGAPWRARPLLWHAASACGPVFVGRKGGCCLAYLTAEPEPGEPPTPDYCSTCSFRDRAETERRQLRWFERRAAGVPSP